MARHVATTLFGLRVEKAFLKGDLPDRPYTSMDVWVAERVGRTWRAMSLQIRLVWYWARLIGGHQPVGVKTTR
jgi:hypothetical protein